MCTKQEVGIRLSFFLSEHNYYNIIMFHYLDEFKRNDKTLYFKSYS